jgi:hypothetical protein
MEINALLCDHAQVAGKLFVSGGGIDAFNMPATDPGPYVINFAIAGVVQVPWTATNQEHRLQFCVVDADGKTPELAGGAEAGPQGLGGEMVFNVGRPPGLPSGDEQLVPFAFQFTGLPLARLGRYSIELTIDGTEVRHISFRVSKPPQPLGYSPSAPGRIGQ